MFYDNELLFIQKMLSKCHLQNILINPNEKIEKKIDKGLRKLFSDREYSETFFDFFPEIKPNTIYRVTDIFLWRYIFLMLPFCEEETVLLIGPYLNTDISRQQILEQGEKMGISPRNSEDLVLFYSSLPIIREENHIFAMINTFAEFLFSGSDNFESCDINRKNSAAFITGNFEIRDNPETHILNINAMENRYNYENELMAAVSQGNIHKAEQMMASFSSLALEKRATDQLRNGKNYCIIMNTLFRKAAERGGVHPVYLDSVSSGFAKKIENTHSSSAILDLMNEILRSYCRLVRQHSVKDYSPLIQKTIIRIESDLTCDLTLNSLAKMGNVSPSYLSSLFKKETGQTLTEFVNNKRIDLAKHLIKNTNLQIQTIAQHCGILDLHYFCRIFKNSVGKTPTEFRNSPSFS